MSDGYPKGRLTRVEDTYGEQIFSYDVRGRIAEERRIINSGTQIPFDTTHQYDTADRETKLTYPDGEQVTTTFDQQGMLESMLSSLGGYYLTSTNYNAAGLPTRFEYGSGHTVNYRYRVDMPTPSDYRIWKIYTVGLTPSEFDQTYTYDSRGNVTSVVDTYFGSSTRTYDHLDRLVSHSGQGGAYAYVYNAIGNLTCKCDWNVYMNVQYGQTANCPQAGPRGCPHALTSATTGLGNNTWHYDANGNLLEERVNGAPRNSFGWDWDNRLQTATYVSTTYDYYRDYNGDLILRSGGGADTAYIGGIFEKVLPNGTITKYYHADGKRIAMRVDGVRKFIITDHQGSTVATVPYSRMWYNPFGELYASDGTIPTDKRFTGQQREYETIWNAIYDYGARMYDAKIGRMLQPDAFYDPYNPQSLNRYSYALNNPTTLTDPTGMYPADMTPAEWGRILRQEKRRICFSCHSRVTRRTGDNGGPDLPVWIAPIAAAEAIGDPLPLDVVVGGITVCVLFCDKAGHTLRNAWDDIMTDTVVLSERTPPEGEGKDIPRPKVFDDPTVSPGEGWEWAGNEPVGAAKGLGSTRRQAKVCIQTSSMKVGRGPIGTTRREVSQGEGGGFSEMPKP